MVDVIATALGDDDNEEGGSGKFDGDARKLAQTYAWEYFKLHGQQRQASFRFYVVIVAALTAALISGENNAPHQLIGAALLVVSLIFWRLDRRNTRLVRLAEAYLVEEEDRLSREMRSQNIRLLTHASTTAYAPLFLRPLTTYSQLNRLIFLAIGGIGLALAWPGFSPWFAHAFPWLSGWLWA